MVGSQDHRATPRYIFAATLTQARELSNGARVVVQMKVEIEGETKPACIADQVLVFYG